MKKDVLSQELHYLNDTTLYFIIILTSFIVYKIARSPLIKIQIEGYFVCIIKGQSIQMYVCMYVCVRTRACVRACMYIMH